MERSKTRPLRNGGNGGNKGLWPALAGLNEAEIAFLTARSQADFWERPYKNKFLKHVIGDLFSPKSTEGRELWEKYWPLIEAAWVKKYPGRRPAAFWFHGVADRDSADFCDLSERAAWPKAKQKKYLKKHALLMPIE